MIADRPSKESAGGMVGGMAVMGAWTGMNVIRPPPDVQKGLRHLAGLFMSLGRAFERAFPGEMI